MYHQSKVDSSVKKSRIEIGICIKYSRQKVSVAIYPKYEDGGQTNIWFQLKVQVLGINQYLKVSNLCLHTCSQFYK